MPDEQSGLFNDTPASSLSATDLSSFSQRLSLKASLAVSLSVGFFLFVLSHYNYLLFHSLIELSSIVLLAAVFLIGWNTRQLVRSQFFLILSVGFLATGFVDLLHTLTYKGVHILPEVGANMATQLWVIARGLAAAAYLCATSSLGKRELLSARQWLLGFLGSALILVILVSPLGVFPVCFVEGEGLTSFKVYAETVIIILFCLAALRLQGKKQYLNERLVRLLHIALALSVLTELIFTFYVDVYGFLNFLGHYFKLGSVVIAYFALVEGTLRSPFTTLFRDMAHSYEELNSELQRRLAAEKLQDIAHREIALLYGMSQAMHSTLNLDELAHLTLSAATLAEFGGFERAALFTVNQRTGMLQGMLGVTRETATMVFPVDTQDWKAFSFDEELCEKQRKALFNQDVIRQRLVLDKNDNALARAFEEKQVILVSDPGAEPAGGLQLAERLKLGPYACAPMAGRDQVIGILLVDNFVGGGGISPHRRRLLELFASQAGSALDNASLVKRLEMAHDDLQAIQEQMIQGEKMAVLGEMAAQVAHELRNPLVSIGGFAQRLAKQDLKDKKANDYAGIIAREVRRMEEMLSNILSFSKKQLVCFEECEIPELLQEVIALENEHCQKQEIELISDFSQTLPMIIGDQRQLRQVFQNLVVNARQAMNDGGVLTVRARSGILRGDRAVVVTVEDTGGGIAPEIMRNIFNPFFSTRLKGTGLGLSISHRIVVHHHGEIEVINGAKGARFIVILPVEQSKRPSAGPGARK